MWVSEGDFVKTQTYVALFLTLDPQALRFDLLEPSHFRIYIRTYTFYRLFSTMTII